LKCLRVRENENLFEFKEKNVGGQKAILGGDYDKGFLSVTNLTLTFAFRVLVQNLCGTNCLDKL
jgi:hypothetical protein